ncbi:unnamed protein product, partial [Dovyalis caffra]
IRDRKNACRGPDATQGSGVVQNGYVQCSSDARMLAKGWKGLTLRIENDIDTIM